MSEKAPSYPALHRFVSHIAGTDIVVQFPNGHYRPSPELEPFLKQTTDDTEGDILLDMTGSHRFCPPQSLQPGNSPAFTSVHQDPDEFWFRRPAGYLWATTDFCLCRAWSPDGGPPLPQEGYNGRPWMMLALWGYLSLRGGALMHGSICVLDDQRHVLFLGDRQTGKSTLGRLVAQAGFSCLTDEYPLLTSSGGHVYAHGTPWPGMRGTPAPLSGPLRAVFFLRHGSSNILQLLHPRKAVSSLLNTVRFFYWDPSSTMTVIDLVDSIAHTVPIYDFRFVPTNEAVQAVREELCASA